MVPITIDAAALFALGQAGYRWTAGRVERVRYRWLLPPDWVLAAELPGRQNNALEPLCGGGDRAGRLTAALTVVRGNRASPSTLVARGAAPGAQMITFRSAHGEAAERVEETDGRLSVTTAHAFEAGGESFRFLVAGLGPGGDADARRVLRTVGVALSLADEVERSVDQLRLGGRLHG